MNTFEYFKLIIIVQIFFGVSITIVAYAMPSDNYIQLIESGQEMDLDETGAMITGAADRQTNIPILDMGALIFYSGNIVLDMILNSVFAIPSMVTTLVSVFTIFFPIDAVLAAYIGIAIFLIIGAIYIISILAFIVNLRGGAGVAGVV